MSSREAEESSSSGIEGNLMGRPQGNYGLVGFGMRRIQ